MVSGALDWVVEPKADGLAVRIVFRWDWVRACICGCSYVQKGWQGGGGGGLHPTTPKQQLELLQPPRPIGWHCAATGRSGGLNRRYKELLDISYITGSDPASPCVQGTHLHGTTGFCHLTEREYGNKPRYPYAVHCACYVGTVGWYRPQPVVTGGRVRTSHTTCQ